MKNRSLPIENKIDNQIQIKIAFPIEMIANRMAQLSDDLEYISVSYLGDLIKEVFVTQLPMHPSTSMFAQMRGMKKKTKQKE